MGELISFEHYLAILEQPALLEDQSTLLEQPYLLVEPGNNLQYTTSSRLPNCPVIAVSPDLAVSPDSGKLPTASVFDLCVNAEDLPQVLATIQTRLSPCTLLVQLLRHNEISDINQGLIAESLSYSTLQQSQGFQAWLAQTRLPEAKIDVESPVLAQWQGSILEITLNRPAAHNAYSSSMKDQLCAILASAYAHDALTKVSLKARGPSFCAGGDLAEFGRVTDPSLAHLSRTTRSAAALISGLTCKTEAHLFGACIGAGIEIPSFTEHIYAHPDSFFQLPEIAMGLLPGAGGTVGISRRIGRQRCGYMAISNKRIDAATALHWGLIDTIA